MVTWAARTKLWYCPWLIHYSILASFCKVIWQAVRTVRNVFPRDKFSFQRRPFPPPNIRFSWKFTFLCTPLFQMSDRMREWCLYIIFSSARPAPRVFGKNSEKLTNMLWTKQWSQEKIGRGFLVFLIHDLYKHIWSLRSRTRFFSTVPVVINSWTEHHLLVGEGTFFTSESGVL